MGPEPSIKPESASWDATVAASDVPAFLGGFMPYDIDNEWDVYTVQLNAEEIAIINFHRSWTGNKCTEIKVIVELDDDGKAAKEADAKVTQISWERDEESYGSPEQDAQTWAAGTAEGARKWLLGAPLQIPSQ